MEEQSFKIVNRYNENDQINKIIKNLLLAYNNRLLSSPINSDDTRKNYNSMLVHDGSS